MKREMEEKGVVPDSHAGFKKGRGTMDSVYILDHLAKSELKKKEGRMCTLFLDFRAAFDKVDTEKMFECMRERERNRRMVGAEGRGDIRVNKVQGKDGRERG
jgi:hypothetical protein